MPKDTSVPSARLLDIVNLNAVLQSVALKPGWTVVVCPNRETVAENLQALTAMLPIGSVMCGRTALLQDGSKISLVAAMDSPFTSPFRMVLLGWSGASGRDYLGKEFMGVAAWRARASRE